MKVGVIDGQGGGIGKALVERIKMTFGANITVTALGTNALATTLMLKAGADEGATGENAILYNVNRMDIIMGPIGILSANALLGELSPTMATAITKSSAQKILIPINKCNVIIAGVEEKSFSCYIDDAIELLRKRI